MTMERFRRVAELWNWLPGFRAVAEHESVTEAAAALHVSASALSRTVKLLESALGAELFVRRGTGLALTQLGGELLAITRGVMRQVDDCIAHDERRRGGDGPFYVAVTSETCGAIVACALARSAPLGGTVHVTRIDADAAVDELLHGNVDLVVSELAARPSTVVACRLGDVRFGLYAAPARALADAALVAVRGIPEPADHRIAIRCDSIATAIALCERAAHACVLPDLAWPSLARHGDAGEPVALCALHRPPLPTGRDDVRLETLVGRLASVVAGDQRG